MASNTTSPAASSSPGGMSLSLPIVLLSVALAVGLPGNSFVVWSILKRMQKRSVTALLVLNLALADLAVLLTAPFFLHALSQRTWSFRVTGCRLCHYICGVSMYASVLLITVMSLDRSLAVARPFVSQKVRTKTVARWVLVSIWVVSFLLATPVLAYRTVKRYNRTLVCRSDYPSDGHSAFHLLFETTTGFLLPFLAVVASYSDIGRRLQARRFRRSRRTGRLVVLIILAFAAFWLPYHLVNLVEAGRALAGGGKPCPSLSVLVHPPTPPPPCLQGRFLTWILPRTPVLSMRLATFTVFPQMSYCGFCAPITPATTGPWFNPGKKCGNEGL
uniref:G-protein coupled receptors family 1 profile domain-containing protein n=1 Tax=Peromyscus maniculatus bairdii TaxID=230844 RepID=A0A8C8T2V2_PERMB